MFSEGVRGYIKCCISDFVLWLRKGVVVRKQIFMQATKDAWVDENRTEVI